jgi:hypothetical protein
MFADVRVFAEFLKKGGKEYEISASGVAKESVNTEEESTKSWVQGRKKKDMDDGSYIIDPTAALRRMYIHAGLLTRETSEKGGCC